MTQYYKQILLAAILSICCAIIRLNADLLNGPWSKESQELVKLAENQALPIPEKFKEKEEVIKTLRNWFADNSNTGKHIYDSLNVDPKFLKDTPVQETIVQIFKKHVTNQDILLQGLLMLALNLEDENFSKAIINAAKQDQRNTLFKMFIELFGSLYIPESPEDYQLLEKIDPFMGDETEKAKELSFTKFKRTTIKNFIAYGADLHQKVRDLPIYMRLVSSINDYVLIDSILSKIEINDFVSYSPTPSMVINWTLLGYAEMLLQQNERLDKDRYYENFRNNDFQNKMSIAHLKKIIPILKARGAKTYADLTAQQKGQK